MKGIPLALQVFVAVILVLGIALGVGFYPVLILEERQIRREREAGLENLATAVTLNVGARVRDEVSAEAYRASLIRLISVPAMRRQLVSVSIDGPRPDLKFHWENPELSFLKDPERAVLHEPSDAPIEPAKNQHGSESLVSHPNVQLVTVLVKGENKIDLARVEIEVSRLETRARTERLKRTQAGALGLSLALVLLTSLFMIRQISNPVKRLTIAMDRLAGGDFEQHLDPAGSREVRHLTEAFNQMAVELKEKERLRLEMESAKAVQTYLLPKEDPKIPGYRITGLSIPAAEVGGDFYQYYLHETRDISLVLGDVSGKGMRAAMLVSVILGSLQALIHETDEPSAVLEKLNRSLCEEIKDRSFATLIFGTLTTRTGLFRFANAGHLYPYRYVAADNRWIETPLAPQSFPSGIFIETTYAASMLALDHGDRVLLLSDGVVEAMNANHEIFGFERLEEALEETARKGFEDTLGRLLGRVRDFTEETPQADDMTAVLIERE